MKLNHHLRILVTGSAGFIGSHPVGRLVEGHDVVVSDDFSIRRIENIKAHLDSKSIHLTKGDVRKPEMLKGL